MQISTEGKIGIFLSLTFGFATGAVLVWPERSVGWVVMGFSALGLLILTAHHFRGLWAKRNEPGQRKKVISFAGIVICAFSLCGFAIWYLWPSGHQTTFAPVVSVATPPPVGAPRLAVAHIDLVRWGPDKPFGVRFSLTNKGTAGTHMPVARITAELEKKKLSVTVLSQKLDAFADDVLSRWITENTANAFDPGDDYATGGEPLVPQSVWRQVVQGKKIMYVYGVFAYSDATLPFDTLRVLTYCAIYTQDSSYEICANTNSKRQIPNDMGFPRKGPVQGRPAKVKVPEPRVIVRAGFGYSGNAYALRGTATGLTYSEYRSDGTELIQFDRAVYPDSIVVRREGSVEPFDIVERGQLKVRFKIPPGEQNSLVIVVVEASPFVDTSTH